MSCDPYSVVDQALSQVQACLEALSESLRAGDARESQQHAQSLRDAVLLLGRTAATAGGDAGPVTRRRVQQMAASLVAQRHALARHLGAVDRMLDSILPPAPSATYGRTVSSQARRSSAVTSLRV
jgi:hypothetical protein